MRSPRCASRSLAKVEIRVSTERAEDCLAVEGAVQLARDGVDLLHPAAVEQHRQGAEDLLDLGVAVGAGERDHRAVRQRRGVAYGGGAQAGGVVEVGARRQVAGRDELDVLLAEQAGLLQVGVGVGGEAHFAVDLHGHPGQPVVPVHRDLLDPAHGDVVDLDRRLREEAGDVLEDRGDAVRVAAEVGAAGQRQVLDAVERRHPRPAHREPGDDGRGAQRESAPRDGAPHRPAPGAPRPYVSAAGSGSRPSSLRSARPSMVRVAGS